ncbi:uncharacterized protein LOC131060119 isoform X2 [Cryptomeria japonica]|uniref:uncharacterized protein LOC131060119 isoform X2 n=1 Tax=Cryptomeria japonica TaxID=3369 RepID=UPI0025AC2E75|nr:uncharacterized protein LOC131060119 isoform X2 [Cryptomeria japonica]
MAVALSLLAVAIMLIGLTRLVCVLFLVGKPLSNSHSSSSVKTLIVLGSGGHTAEMLNLVAVLKKERFYPRWYVAAATDNMSLERARTAEESRPEQVEGKLFQGAEYMKIYRSREVGQSYLTSVGTTLVAMIHAMWLICQIRPDVVIGIKWVMIFYVESIARVKKLSLSGWLLYKLHLADQLFVQWPQLKQKYTKAHYVGRLM